MTNPADEIPPARPLASTDAGSSVPPGTHDERAARRVALRELAAMIGVEVFY